jgi:hypothetical protein
MKKSFVSVGVTMFAVMAIVGCAVTPEEESGESSSEEVTSAQTVVIVYDNRARRAGECAQGDGLYCGGHGVQGPANYLLRCSGSRVLNAGMCASTCLRKPSGQDDRCATTAGGGDQPPASACPYGNGRYCGGNGVSGRADILFSCQNGVQRVVTGCASGCVREVAGVNDHCR